MEQKKNALFWKWIWRALALAGIIWYIVLLPDHLFKTPTSTVIYAKDGRLLGAHIADDGQWRFPHSDQVPYKFAAALLQFEDRHFFEHHGVHLPSLFRAMQQNVSEGKIVRGGSTLTMQVIRMSRGNPGRTIAEKCYELILAGRLELKYSKAEILAFYASNAPFGGNVVGLEAASWRYFGRSPEELSWAESATLAVLPNAPALIYPGRNQDALKAKRDRVLDQLSIRGLLTPTDCELAKSEPLPGYPKPVPRLAPHLLSRAINEGQEGKRVYTTLDYDWQVQANRLVQHHQESLAGNEIFNAAAIVIDIKTGATVAYVGNTSHPESAHGNAVDIITSPRSTGSVLKPFLYAAALNDGVILPHSLVPDIPTRMQGFAPENYTRSYDGAVPAHRALARSLNVPAVRLLRDYGLERFHYVLQKLPLPHVNQSAEHYGLTLILGGAESSLWEVTGAYASAARTVAFYPERNGGYDKYDFRLPHYRREDSLAVSQATDQSVLGAASLYLTFEALREVNRPENQEGWQDLSSSQRIAWKTGTSVGHRDAWAVGTTGEYAIGVWVGNASGKGRKNLTGISSAAPLLFELFDQADQQPWFDPPYDEMEPVAVCAESGYRLLPNCVEVDTVWAPRKGLRAPGCPYHQLIHVDTTETWQVNHDCAPDGGLVSKPWFILPPVMEWYFRSRNPSYQPVPAWHPSCAESADEAVMEWVYPRFEPKLFIPREQDGEAGKVIFEVAHRKSGSTLFWHLNDEYQGQTTDIHQMPMRPPLGQHRITIVDESGHSIERSIEVLNSPE